MTDGPQACGHRLPAAARLAWLATWTALFLPACLVAPGGSYQVPDNLAPGDYRFGIGAGVGPGICLLPEEGQPGGEGSVWFDLGASELINLRFLAYGQAWLSQDDPPWAVGGSLEIKAALEQLDLALLFGLSVAWFSGQLVGTPGIGLVYRFWEEDGMGLTVTVRSSYGFPLMVLQLGTYLGLDVAFGERLGLRPELGVICYTILDQSEVGGCLAGGGVGLVF